MSGAAAGSAASVRAQAAAWAASQLGSDETIGCDPAMCAALGAHGVAASRLLELGPTAPASAADVIAAPASARLQDAPVPLASFGSGASRIEIRAAATGGSAAYQQALVADLAARRSAGAQLLHSRVSRLPARAPQNCRRVRWIPGS